VAPVKEGAANSIRVSFIVPALNEERSIEATLRSILGQRFPREEFEVLLVDNGSRDRTREIAAGLDGVRVLEESRRGAGSSRNRGAIEAKGEFLAFVDAGSLLDPDWLSALLPCFLCPEVAAVQGRIQVVSADGTRVPEIELHNLSIRDSLDLLTTDLQPVPVLDTASTVIRAEVFRELGGFDPGLLRMEDAELSYRLYRAGWILGRCAAALCRESGSRPRFLPLARIRWKTGRYKVEAGDRMGLPRSWQGTLFQLWNEVRQNTLEPWRTWRKSGLELRFAWPTLRRTGWELAGLASLIRARWSAKPWASDDADSDRDEPLPLGPVSQLRFSAPGLPPLGFPAEVRLLLTDPFVRLSNWKRNLGWKLEGSEALALRELLASRGDARSAAARIAAREGAGVDEFETLEGLREFLGDLREEGVLVECP
jgi:glycosyltransferase involved in cell wall biosynthesis